VQLSSKFDPIFIDQVPFPGPYRHHLFRRFSRPIRKTPSHSVRVTETTLRFTVPDEILVAPHAVKAEFPDHLH